MNKLLLQSALILVAAAIFLTVSYFRYVDLQRKANDAAISFNECGRLVERMNEIKSRIPEKLVAPDSLQPANRALDLLTQNQVTFEGEPFASELPAVSLGSGSLQTVNISIPKARMSMSQVVQLLKQIDGSSDPLFVSDVSLERIKNLENEQDELWRVGVQLFVVKRASK